MSKSELFKAAWRMARNAAEKFGGSSKEYFAECLILARKGVRLIKYFSISSDAGIELVTEEYEAQTTRFFNIEPLLD